MSAAEEERDKMSRTYGTSHGYPVQPYAPGRRHIVVRDGSTFIVYNGESRNRRGGVWVPPLPRTKDSTGELAPFELRKAQWFSQRHPFMGHAPVGNTRLTGLLSCLNFDRHTEWIAPRQPKEDKAVAVKEYSARVAREQEEEKEMWLAKKAGSLATTSNAFDVSACEEDGRESAGNEVVVEHGLSTVVTETDIETRHGDGTSRSSADEPKWNERSGMAGEEVYTSDTEAHTHAIARSNVASTVPLQPTTSPRRPASVFSTTVRAGKRLCWVEETIWNLKFRKKSREQLEAEEVDRAPAREAQQERRLREAQDGTATEAITHAIDDVETVDEPPVPLYELEKDEEKMERWKDLEGSLYGLLDVLKTEKNFGANFWMLESEPYRWPNTFAYGLKRRSGHQARLARASFHGLIAIVRMYVEAYRAQSVGNGFGGQTTRKEDARVEGLRDSVWTRAIVEKYAYLSVSWLEDILDTAVGADRPGRVGAFLDLRDVYLVRPAMDQIALGMPVYVVCEQSSQAWMNKLEAGDKWNVMALVLREAEDPNFYRSLRAKLGLSRVEGQSSAQDLGTESDVMQTFDLSVEDYIHVDYAVVDIETHKNLSNVPSSSNPLVSLSVVPPDANTNVPRGIVGAQTPTDLLQSHSLALTVLEKTENEVEKRTRKAREKHALLQRPPGKRSKGARCFEWKEDDNGVLFRCYVSREEVEEKWGQYNEYSRKYLSAWNEWDMWLGYDTATDGSFPAHPVDDDASFEGDDDSEDEENALPKLQGKKMEAFDLGPPSFCWNYDNPKIYERQLLAFAKRQWQARTVQELRLRHGASTVVERAHKYFGFVPDAARHPSARPSDNSVRLSLLKMYEVPEWQSKVPPSVLQDIHELVEAIEHCEGDASKLDPALCDLNKEFSTSILRRTGSPVTISVRALVRPQRTDSNSEHAKRRILSSDVYVLRSSDESGAVCLAVTDALVALRCLRFSGSTQDLWYDLLTSGVPVHFLRSRVATVSEHVPRPLPRLLVDEITEVDYMQYKARLLYSLSSNPRLRIAALKEGGIVWRLVAPYLDAREVLQSIADVGSVPAFGGASISGYPTLFDDDLTVEEERVVCGVYDSATSDITDATVRSWWPRAWAWSRSSVNAGQWTSYNERWFLERSALLESGAVAGELRSQQQWRYVLEGQKKRGDRFIRRGKELASNFLNSL